MTTENVYTNMEIAIGVSACVVAMLVLWYIIYLLVAGVFAIIDLLADRRYNKIVNNRRNLNE